MSSTLTPTSTWYQTQYGCPRGVDPTEIARRHTFPDAMIPRGIPEDPAADSKICLEYRNAWPAQLVNPVAMIEVERQHPQFAFHPGGPGTPAQIDVESQLRRLDQPLTNCQAILPTDAPLFRNTVAPPRPVGVSYGVNNAANPVAAMVREEDGQCRKAADSVATGLSSRTFHNPTRYDTTRFAVPFTPPGIGS